jgi:hypothetical protein
MILHNMLHVPYSYKVDNLAYDLPVHVDDWSDAVHESKDSASSDSDDSGRTWTSTLSRPIMTIIIKIPIAHMVG